MMGLFMAAAWAGEDVHETMAIAIVESDGDNEMLIEFDGADIDLQGMQVGENRSFVDENGRSILVTRGENGMTFNVDGKVIEMPAIMAHEEGNMWVSEGHQIRDIDVDVQVLHKGMASKTMMDSENVVIISGKEIDAATQDVIRTALESAGHPGVEFIGGGGDGGPHGVHMVRKVVEVTK